MKKSRFTDEQSAFALKQAESGTPTATFPPEKGSKWPEGSNPRDAPQLSPAM